jgi:hypothetical protein
VLLIEICLGNDKLSHSLPLHFMFKAISMLRQCMQTLGYSNLFAPDLLQPLVIGSLSFLKG